MAAVQLEQVTKIIHYFKLDSALQQSCLVTAFEIRKAIVQEAIQYHPKTGKQVFAYEVDGFGNFTFMDDANVPSLLSLPELGFVSKSDKIYQNTREFILGAYNPYYFEGRRLKGVGSPHVGLGYVWPISIITRAFTATDVSEIRECVQQLITASSGTGFVHEGVWMNDENKFTRSWFAWANSYFASLIANLLETESIQ